MIKHSALAIWSIKWQKGDQSRKTCEIVSIKRQQLPDIVYLHGCDNVRVMYLPATCWELPQQCNKSLCDPYIFVCNSELLLKSSNTRC